MNSWVCNRVCEILRLMSDAGELWNVDWKWPFFILLAVTFIITLHRVSYSVTVCKEEPLWLCKIICNDTVQRLQNCDWGNSYSLFVVQDRNLSSISAYGVLANQWRASIYFCSERLRHTALSINIFCFLKDTWNISQFFHSLYSHKQCKYLKQLFLKVGGVWVEMFYTYVFISQLNWFFEVWSKGLEVRENGSGVFLDRRQLARCWTMFWQYYVCTWHKNMDWKYII